MSLCKYKDIFGKPGKGAHAYRIFNIAIVDVIFTLLGAYAVIKYFNTSPGWTIFGAFLLGVIAHKIFCVKTTLNSFIFKYIKL